MTNIITDYSNANPAGIWREYPYNMDASAGMAKYVARAKYAFPGGYEIYAITDDGGILCHNCCRAEFSLIAHSDPGNGWHVCAVTTTAEDESLVICDHCANPINIQCEDCFETYDTLTELHNHVCSEHGS